MRSAPGSATVLVVDDDAGNIAILTKLLESEYQVASATSGARALDMIRASQPDLILLDVMMPSMDGYEVCSLLKADPATAGIPIIFLTGLDSRDEESKALELGAMDYVTKPFNAAVVRARVRNHVELKKMHDQVRSLAASDGLTGLANRRRFDEAIDVECRRLARTNSQLSLIMLDIDHFKGFNDTYGHVAGDDCLRRVGDTIRAAMRRAPDIAARYGGEEFACILPDTGLDAAALLASQIRARIESLAIPHAASSAGPVVTASLGVASITCTPSTQPTDLLKAADACLYEAKESGRNRVVATGSPP